MFKVNNKDTICVFIVNFEHGTNGVFIVNFEHVSHLVLVFLLLTLSK